MSNSSSSSILNKTITKLTKNEKFHIFVHDTSGILDNDQLKLDMMYKVHFCDFCNIAKSTEKGVKFCYQCKKLSMKKANSTNATFIGQCYLGMTEIIKPIYFNNSLLCLIYITNLTLKGDLENIKEKILKRATFTGIDSTLLIDKIKSCEIINPDNLENFFDILDILEHIILHCDIPYTTLSFKAFTPFPVENTKKHLLINDITKFITTNYAEEILLKDLAKLYFIDEQYLCKLFKKETGMGFIEFINKTRIANAKRLLINSDSKINSVAYQVGYSNTSHFNKIFKKLTGYTPKEFKLVNK